MNAVARRSLASAAATPLGELVGLDDPAGQHRTTGREPLTHDLQAEFVKTAERTQVRAHETQRKIVTWSTSTPRSINSSSTSRYDVCLDLDERRQYPRNLAAEFAVGERTHRVG